MVVSKTQRKAAQKYQKENTKTISIQLSKKYDVDILFRLDNVQNKTQYIKELIRKDINESTLQNDGRVK